MSLSAHAMNARLSRRGLSGRNAVQYRKAIVGAGPQAKNRSYGSDAMRHHTVGFCICKQGCVSVTLVYKRLLTTCWVT